MHPFETVSSKSSKMINKSSKYVHGPCHLAGELITSIPHWIVPGKIQIANDIKLAFYNPYKDTNAALTPSWNSTSSLLLPLLASSVENIIASARESIQLSFTGTEQELWTATSFIFRKETAHRTNAPLAPKEFGLLTLSVSALWFPCLSSCLFQPSQLP